MHPNIPWTFLGTADDVVYRYPFAINYGGHHDVLRQILLRHALFGSPLVIHEGYLVHHPHFRTMLTTNPNNIIVSLIRHGRILVLSQFGDIITDQFYKMQSGTNTSSSLAFRDQLPSLELCYNQLSALLRSTPSIYSATANAPFRDSFLRLPPDAYVRSSVARKRLLLSIIESESPYDVGLTCTPIFFDRFRKTFKDFLQRSSPRSAWEDAVLHLCPSRHPDSSWLHNEFMTLATEAHHLATALSIADEYHFPLKIETHFSNRFDKYVPYKASYDENINRSKINIRVPYTNLLSRAPEIFDDLFDDSHSLCAARMLYLQNPYDEHAARLYEKQIYNYLGLSTTISEYEDSVNKWTNYSSAFVIAFGSAAHDIYRKSTKHTRRGFLRKNVDLFIGGATAVALNFVPNVAGDIVQSQVAVVVDYSDKNVRYVANEPSFENSYMNAVGSSMGFLSNLEVDVNNERSRYFLQTIRQDMASEK